MHFGIPKVVKHAVKDVKDAGSSVINSAEHPVRTAKKAGSAVKDGVVGTGKSLLQDGFDVVNGTVKHLTSASNKALVRKELSLAQRAQDPALSPQDRANAQRELRILMGGSIGQPSDPLPDVASAQAEQDRAANATVWNVEGDPASTPAQWATNDAAGQRKSDPVNIYVHGNLSDIIRTFEAAGWSIAAPNDSQGTSAYQDAVTDYLTGWGASQVPGVGGVDQSTYQAVNKMPVGDLYLNGQKPLVSMEANNHPLTGRDHFRIYWTGKKDENGQNIYAVTASRDDGVELDPDRSKTAYTNHFTEKNADAERDFVLQTLLAGGATVQTSQVQRDFSGGPEGGLYSGDGKVYDLVVSP